MCQGVNLKSGCQQSSGCSWRQALIACQGVNIMSGGNSSSGRITQVRVFYFVRVFPSSQGVNLCQGELLKSGDDNQVKPIRVKFFIRVSKASQGVSAHTLQLDKKPRKLLLETQLLWRNNVVLTRSRCTNV